MQHINEYKYEGMCDYFDHHVARKKH